MKLLKKTIVDIAKLANLSYFNQLKIDEFYKNKINDNKCCTVLDCCKDCPCLIKSNLRSDEDCQLYSINYDDNLVFSFRGTESKSDILADLNISRVKLYLANFKEDDCPLVHDGFYDQFITVKDRIENKINEYVNNDEIKNKNIIFSGHSLGGGLATISALYFGVIYSNIPITCITFGSPRVGCEMFANLFNKVVNKSLRFVNDNDPVPCFPSSIRFTHVDQCVWMNQDKIKKEINAWRFWRFFKNSCLNIFGYGYFALGDHSCENYVDDIETLDDKEINKII